MKESIQDTNASSFYDGVPDGPAGADVDSVYMERDHADFAHMNAELAIYIDEHFSEEIEARYVTWLKKELPAELQRGLRSVFTDKFIEDKLSGFIATQKKLLSFCSHHATKQDPSVAVVGRSTGFRRS